MKVLVFDNYDSFTYNLVYILRELGQKPDVIRNNKLSLEAVGRYDKILLSPGPGLPSEAGSMLPLIQTYGSTKSILGVCLGHQGIAEAYGAQLENLGDVLHGVAHPITVTAADEPLFAAIPQTLTVGRYHSWSVVAASLPDDIRCTATDEQGRVMALAHTRYDVRGVQFHPESVLTQHGLTMMQNWLSL